MFVFFYQFAFVYTHRLFSFCRKRRNKHISILASQQTLSVTFLSILQRRISGKGNAGNDRKWGKGAINSDYGRRQNTFSAFQGGFAELCFFSQRCFVFTLFIFKSAYDRKEILSKTRKRRGNRERIVFVK